MRNCLLLLVGVFVAATLGCGGSSGGKFVMSDKAKELLEQRRSGQLAKSNQDSKKKAGNPTETSEDEKSDDGDDGAKKDDGNKAAKKTPPAPRRRIGQPQRRRPSTAASGPGSPKPKQSAPAEDEADDEADEADDDEPEEEEKPSPSRRPGGMFNDGALSLNPAGTGDAPERPKRADDDDDDSNAPAARRGGRRAIGTGMGGPGRRPNPPSRSDDSSDDGSEDDSDAEPSNFYEKAVKAFREGKEADAVQFLYAHVLTDENAPEEYPINWVSGLSEPRLFLRFAVGINYSAPKSFDGRPPVVGDPAPVGRRGRNIRSARGSGSPGTGGTSRNRGRSPFAGVKPDTSKGMLLYYTGEYGEKVLERLEMRRTHSDGYYGKILRDINFEEQEVNTGPVPRPRGGGINDGALSAQDSGNLRGPAIDVDNKEIIGTLSPGILMLGKGKKNQLISRAEKYGVDVLILFDVTVSHSNSTGISTSSTRVKFIPLKEGAETISGRQMKSDSIAKSREKLDDDDDDPVEKALDKLFAGAADNVFRTSEDLPKGLTPERAQKRIAELAKQETNNPLRPMVEALSYFRKGLIEQADLSTAYTALIGEDNAQKLLDGELEDKEAAISDWLPPEFDLSSEADDSEFR